MISYICAVLRYAEVHVIQQLIQSIKDSLARAQHIEAVRQAFVTAVADLHLDAKEVAVLRAEVAQHQLTADEVREIGMHVLHDVSQRVKQDVVVTDGEVALMQQIVQLTQVPSNQLGDIMATLYVQRKMYEVSQGRLSPIQVMGVNLLAGEQAYWNEPVTLIEERVVRREMVGRSQGVNIRIMRGVSYRIGGSRGQTMPVYGDVPIATGELILTNQRVLFKGDKKSIALLWRDVIGIDPYTNAITIHSGKAKQPLRFFYARNESSELVAQIASYLMK